MKNTRAFLLVFLCLSARASLITAIPGPDDQGGMLMPMVTLTGTDNAMNPSSGTVSVSFNPGSVPFLRSLQEWSPGNWFAEGAGWRPDLGSAAGVGGTPSESAGDGDLFNNQYGFMFMAMPMMGAANIPAGKSLGIRLTGRSSSLLRSFNYVNADNRWDEVFANDNDQVLWNGSMWHNYFTVPDNAPAGTYSATFEIFVADQAFTSGTGWADYTPAAQAAPQNPNFTAATVEYTWNVVPEPGTLGLILLGLAGIAKGLRARRG